MAKAKNPDLNPLLEKGYPAGFVTTIPTIDVTPGLSEAIIREISAKKNEPAFLLEWRLKAYRHWLTMKEPHWANIHYPPLRYQDYSYFSAPSDYLKPKDLSEVDPALIDTYKRLGIPLQEQKWLSGVAVDAVFDSVSVATTLKETLEKVGILFCSFSEAAQKM